MPGYRVHKHDIGAHPGVRTKQDRLPVQAPVWRGEQASEALAYFGFPEQELVRRIEDELREQVNKQRLAPQEADGMLADYRCRLRRYTYLD